MTKLNGQISNLTSNLADTNKKLVDAQGLVKTDADNLAACQQKSQSDLAQLQSQLDDDKTKLDAQATQITGLQNDKADLNTTVSTLNNILNCANFPPLTNLDYTSNTTIAKALITYVGDQDGSVTNSTWDVLYGNSKTSIHKIDGKKYLWVFVVTFASDQNSENSVFLVSAPCFLDRPK